MNTRSVPQCNRQLLLIKSQYLKWCFVISAEILGGYALLLCLVCMRVCIIAQKSILSFIYGIINIPRLIATIADSRTNWIDINQFLLEFIGQEAPSLNWKSCKRKEKKKKKRKIRKFEIFTEKSKPNRNVFFAIFPLHINYQWVIESKFKFSSNCVVLLNQ